MVSVDAWIERVLDDWGWWVRGRAASGYRCLSAEGRYRPPRVADEPAAPRLVDEQMCVDVERTISHPNFPMEARHLLKGWYVLRGSPGYICAVAGIPRSAFGHRLEWATRVLRNRLPGRAEKIA